MKETMTSIADLANRLPQTRDAEAVTGVLKPGLAKDAIAKANTELKDFDGEIYVHVGCTWTSSMTATRGSRKS